jgi:hypothetical protein
MLFSENLMIRTVMGTASRADRYHHPSDLHQCSSKVGGKPERRHTFSVLQRRSSEQPEWCRAALRNCKDVQSIEVENFKISSFRSFC